MKTYNVYYVLLFVYILTSYLIIDYRSYKPNSMLTKIILYWMVFGIFIGLYEFLLYFNTDYIISLPKMNKYSPNYWVEHVSVKDIFDYKYWCKGWREYGEYCDTRYIKPTNLTHYLELTHAVTVCIFYVYILYYYHNYRTLNTKLIWYILIFVASIHLIGTIIYFITLEYYLKKNPIKKGTKYWIYLLINVLWLIFPSLIIYKGISILRKLK